MNEKQKKILLLSLLAYAIGGFLFAIGVMLHTTITIISFYIVAVALMVAGILCLFNNYKLEKKTTIYLFLAIIGVLLVIFVSFATYSQL